MNNENPATTVVAEDDGLTYVDPSVGKIENVDDNSVGKLLGVSNTSKKTLEKTAVFGMGAQTVEASAPSVEAAPIPAPQETPLPIPTVNEPPVMAEPVAPAVAGVEEPLPVSINPQVGELNKPIDVTEVPLLNGELPKDALVETTTIPEPMPLSQESNDNINAEPVVPAMPGGVEAPAEAAPVEAAPVEAAQPVLPPMEPVVALEPDGVNNEMFVGAPESVPVDGTVVSAVDQAVADLQAQGTDTPEPGMAPVDVVPQMPAEFTATPVGETPAPTEMAPVEEPVAPVEAAPVVLELPVLNGVPEQAVPAEMAPVEETVAPVEAAPIPELPVLNGVPEQAAPAEMTPVEETVAPVEAAPIPELPVLNAAPEQAAPVELAPAETTSVEETVVPASADTPEGVTAVEVESDVKPVESERFSIDKAKEEMFSQLEMFFAKVQEEVDKYVNENKIGADNQAINQVVQDSMTKLAESVSQTTAGLTDSTSMAQATETVMPVQPEVSTPSLGM